MFGTTQPQLVKYLSEFAVRDFDGLECRNIKMSFIVFPADMFLKIDKIKLF